MAVGPASLFIRTGAPPAARLFVPLVPQSDADSSLHERLSEMWATVRTETNGRVETQVLPLNNNITGSDPAALKMLVAGEIQFFTLMGGILGTVVPVAEVQQVPFAFRSAPHAHQAMDGALGAYILRGDGGEGHPRLPRRRVRQRHAADQAAGSVRRAGGSRRDADARARQAQMLADTFRTLGAEPVTINSSDIYAALKAGKVDAHENPLALVDLSSCTRS